MFSSILSVRVFQHLYPSILLYILKDYFHVLQKKRNHDSKLKEEKKKKKEKKPKQKQNKTKKLSFKYEVGFVLLNTNVLLNYHVS